MYNIGVDIGGTKIAIGVILKDKVIKKEQIKTPSSKNVKEIIDVIKNTIDMMVSNDEYENIGIGFPGIVNEGIVTAPNLNFKNVNLKKLLEEVFTSKNIYVENDANVATAAELCYGVLKESKNSLLITLGTGIGGGIVLNGKLYKGSFGIAGEIGHQVIEKDGKKCGCGRHGCFESYASTSALVERCKEEEGLKLSSIFSICKGDINNIDAKMIMEAYITNDKLARTLIEKHIEYICIGIVNLLNIFDLEMVAIGGGLSQNDIIINLIKEEIRNIPTLRGNNLSNILPANFYNDAGIIGAANLYLIV